MSPRLRCTKWRAGSRRCALFFRPPRAAGGGGGPGGGGGGGRGGEQVMALVLAAAGATGIGAGVGFVDDDQVGRRAQELVPVPFGLYVVQADDGDRGSVEQGLARPGAALRAAA